MFGLTIKKNMEPDKAILLKHYEKLKKIFFRI